MIPIKPDGRNTIFSRGAVAISGGFLVSLVIGTIYLWGIISVYIVSYFRVVDDPNLSKDQVSLVFPFMFIGQATAMPIGVKVMKKLGVKPCCVGAACVLFAIMYLSSFFRSFYTFALVYGMMGGFMIGFLYMVPVAHCYKFFPKSKGTVSGIIVAGSGFGTLFFSFIATAIINPANAKPGLEGYFDQQVANRVPEFIRILSYLSFFFIILGSQMLIDLLPGMDPYKDAYGGHDHKNELVALMDAEFQLPPDQEDQDDNPFPGGNIYGRSFVPGLERHTQSSGLGVVSLGSFGVGIFSQNYAMVDQKGGYQAPNRKHKSLELKQKEEKPDLHHHDSGNQCPRLRDAPTVFIFWILFACMTLGSNFGLMISSNYKYYAYYTETHHKQSFLAAAGPDAVYTPLYQDKFLSTVGALGAVANGLSRFVWAFLLDRFDFQCLYPALLILNGVLAATISVAVNYPSLYLLYVVLVYFCYGGHLGMFPALTSKIFGMRNGSQIYGLLFQAFAMSNLTQYVFVKLLKPIVGYTFMFYLEVIFSLMSLLIICTAKLEHDWAEKIRQNNERKRLAAR